MKKMKILFALFVISSFLMVSTPFVSGASVTPLKSELSITLTNFDAYTTQYKVQDALISGKVMDLTSLPDGFYLPKSDAIANLDYIVLKNDPDLIATGTGTDYSEAFINSTFNTVVESIAAATAETSALTSGTSDTVLTGTVYSNGTLATMTYTSDIYWDSNGDGDFVDTGDRAYYPLASTSVYFLIQAKMDVEDVSTQAVDYIQTSLVFETAGSDYTVSVIQNYGAGNSAWSYSGSTSATLNLYDCDGVGISTILPLAEIISEAGASVTLKGLDQIQVVFSTSGSGTGDELTATLHNIAMFNHLPSLTDREDNDNDWDFDGSGDVAVNNRDDVDLIQTSITEGATESYDNTIELKSDMSGQVTFNDYVKYIRFTGYAAILPDVYSFSSSYISAGKYLTTEQLTFTTTSINDLEALSNIITISAVVFNVTIDDNVIWDSSDYEINLVSFKVDKVSQFNTFYSTWEDSASDNAVISYDIANFDTNTGSVQTVEIAYYTTVNYSGSGEITQTTTVEGGVIIIAGNEQQSPYEWASSFVNKIITGDVQAWSFLVITLIFSLAFIGLIKGMKGSKKGRRK